MARGAFRGGPVYAARSLTPFQLAQKISAQCRSAFDAEASEPSDRDVRDGEIIVQRPHIYLADVPIGGTYRWETSFRIPYDVAAFGIHAYKIRHDQALIDWGAKVVVHPDLSVELVEVFGRVPRDFESCLRRWT
jgi:hypothetical protein